MMCRNKLLTLLAAADLCTSLGIFVLGMMRKALYEQIMETSRIPVETAWTCAWKPFVYLRLIGALIPPCVVLWISVERFLAVFAPATYRKNISPNSHLPLIAILSYTVVAVIIAYTMSWYHRMVPVEAYCGRKNAFTRNYTTFVYLADFFGFFIALVINCVTLCGLGRLYTQREHRFEVKRQLKRIHYLLIISLVSTLTVAIPNGISLTSAWFHRLNIALSDPANWMIAAKCSVNLFVYLLLKAGYRQRVYEILGCLSNDHRLSRRFGAGLSQHHGGGPVIETLQQQQELKRDSIVDLAKMMAFKQTEWRSTRKFCGGQMLNVTNLVTDNRDILPSERRENARKAWALSRYVSST
ncbi:hypothetical protein GPALN_010144 [Globodera pallida]|nr:hypothetical protein GPALN_010144 [Globodera pallida]